MIFTAENVELIALPRLSALSAFSHLFSPRAAGRVKEGLRGEKAFE
jgi:hypothetical protein